MRTRAWILAAFSALALTACEQQPPGDGASAPTQPATGKVTFEDVQRSAGEAAGKAYDYVREKTIEYKRRLEPTLGAAEQQIEQLRNRLSEAADEARPAIERRIAELRDKAAAAREKFQRVTEASDEAWDEAQAGMEAALEELRNALNETPPATPETQPAEQAER